MSTWLTVAACLAVAWVAWVAFILLLMGVWP